MKFTLEIEMGNAAMCRLGHVVNALRAVATQLIETRAWYEINPSRKIMDANGNSVGFWKLERDSHDSL